MSSAARPRAFGSLDAAILAAVLGSAAAVTMIEPATVENLLGLPPGGGGSYRATRAVLERRRQQGSIRPGIVGRTATLKWLLNNVLISGPPFLMVSAPGLVLATLRRPAIPPRRQMREVGSLTSVVLGAITAACLLNEFLLRRFAAKSGAFGPDSLMLFWSQTSTYISVAVAALWIVLTLGGRWRARPHWRDRLGRATGAAWIAYGVLSWIVAPLWLFG